MKSSLTTADVATYRPYIGYFLYSVLVAGGFNPPPPERSTKKKKSEAWGFLRLLIFKQILK